MGAPSGLPSSSGARITGDDYQHIYTWLHALALLRSEKGVTRVEFEVRDAGNVDDLVVHRREQPTLYHQIKFVVDQREPLSAGWFTTPALVSSKSPLRQFHASFAALRGQEGAPEMALVTNRLPVADDPVLKHISGRDSKLVPRLSLPGPLSASGRARLAWAEHLGVSEEELLEMLGHLAIKPGQSSLEDLRSSCCDAMVAAGLRGSSEDLLVGVGVLRDLIGKGCRELTPDALREIVSTHGLVAAERQATLLVQAIARLPHAEHAVAALDWVALFRGATVAERRQLIDPAEWNRRLKPELVAAVDRIRGNGFKRVRVGGAFRLATGFAIGESLLRSEAFEVSFRDYDSSLAPAAFEVVSEAVEISTGPDLAIGISVSDDLSTAVLDYLRREALPISRFVNVRPATGPDQWAIAGPEEGLGFVRTAFTEVRAAIASCGGSVHLFLCAPNGIAILLGHLWNRMPDTVVYEDANGPAGYFPTFSFARR